MNFLVTFLAVITLQCISKTNALIRMDDMIGWNQKSMPLLSSANARNLNDLDWDDEEYIPYKDQRHDQFDWKLTKVYT